MNHQAEREKVSSSTEYAKVLRDLRYGRVVALRHKQSVSDGAHICIVEVMGESGTTAAITFTLYQEKGIVITAADAVDYFGKELAWKSVIYERDWADLGKALKLEQFARMRAFARWVFLLTNK